MITGTHHFVDRKAAIEYYRVYEDDFAEETVDHKIRKGEIVIGKPKLSPGHKLVVNEGRYFISL